MIEIATRLLRHELSIKREKLRRSVEIMATEYGDDQELTVLTALGGVS